MSSNLTVSASTVKDTQVIWPFTRKPKQPTDVEIFTTFARDVFDGILEENPPIIANLRNDPAAAGAYWEGQVARILEWVNTNQTSAERTLKLRAEWAQSAEHLALALYYTKLPDEDRDLFAKNCLKSTRAEQDAHYGLSRAEIFVETAILEGFVRDGWDGDDKGRDQLLKMASLLMDQCKEQYDLLLTIAKLESQGQQLSDTQKEAGKTTMLLKEAARRRLAGIPFDDE